METVKNFCLICASLSLVAIAWPVSINEWTKVFKTCQGWVVALQNQAAVAAYENSPEGKAKQDKEKLESTREHREKPQKQHGNRTI
jgi:hypothetical protein